MVFLQLAHHSHCPSDDMGCDTRCLAGHDATVDTPAAITVLQLGHHYHPTSCHLALRRGLPAAQLGACLALIHAQGHVRLGRKARGFWSIHWLSVG